MLQKIRAHTATIGVIGQGYVGLRSLYRQAMKRNDTVFFQNPDNRDLFLETGILGDPAKAVLINGSGVDTEHFAPFPSPSWKPWPPAVR